MREVGLENIGEQLSAARQAQGLSIAEAAARLRIRTKFVDAMESEHWSVVGEFVYVRGFLKNYAELLGLDAAPLLVSLRSRYQPEAAVPRSSAETAGAQTLPVASARSSARERVWFPWVMGSLTTLAAVLVIMVTVSVIGMLTGQNRAQSVTPAQQPATSSTAAAFSKPSENATNGMTAGSSEDQSSGVNLRLQLTQRSWLSVIVDGKRVVYETLPAGTVREFHGAREITLRAGNAGGVMANIDGKNLGALGQAGEVKDRVFAVKTPLDAVTGAHE